ncbi:MAG: PD-(D/E)XK nuclease family transposase [Oscillospiraceae bacterium]|nr:PD-(D/E)XK nuclease family transposase [Oscillospiraceae bacterium]
MIKTVKTPEQRREDELRTIANYRPIDDDFMRELFRDDLPLAQYVLRTITGIEDLQLISQTTQYDMKRLLGSRSICLDVFGTDSKGRKFDLEIQRADSGATPQRARYHSSAIDVEFLKAKEEFTELPESYVIFITENDVRGEKRLIYSFERTETSTGSPLGDGTHIIFVNGAYNNAEDTSELAKLVHDLRCKSADEMYTKQIADKTRFFKETPEGVSIMCKAMEELCNERAKEAVIYEKIQIAVNLLNRGKDTFEEISALTGLTLEEVQELAKELDHVTA